MWLKRLLILMVAAAVGVWLYGWTQSASADFETPKADTESVTKPEPVETSFTKKMEIVPEATYGQLMDEAGVPAGVSAAIYTAAEDVYDLARIRVGRALVLEFEKTSDELEQLTYQIDSEEVLHVRIEGDEWVAEREEIAYETRVRTVEGVVETSLYESALDQGLDERAIIALAEVFQWTIDFALDVRKGDSYKFIFEERYLDGEYVMPGDIIAAKYVNDGDERLAFRFESAEGNTAYFNEEGESMQKIFLKAPVAFKYISSGFTTGLRYVSAFNTSTGHRAIDYAASHGTPIRAVGDGTVVYAGWNGPFGYFVSIRHNGTYTTNYAHQSRLAVRRGQKVVQGQTIGYVGSTGFSTGPHLHYEMVKFGTKINPLHEEFPGTDPVPEERMDDFKKIVERYRSRLR